MVNFNFSNKKVFNSNLHVYISDRIRNFLTISCFKFKYMRKIFCSFNK